MTEVLVRRLLLSGGAIGCLVLLWISYFIVSKPIQPDKRAFVLQDRSVPATSGDKEPSSNSSPESRQDRLGQTPNWASLVLQRPLEDPKPAALATSLPPKRPTAKPAPEVRLELKLTGILADDDPTFRRAWIQFRGKSRMVRVGDTVDDHPGNPKVATINVDDVSFQLGDQIAKLEFEDDELGLPLREAL